MGKGKDRQLLLSATNLGLLSSLGLWLCLRFKAQGKPWLAIPTGVTSALGLLGCLVTIHMRKLKPADSHTWSSMCGHYSLLLILRIIGRVYYPFYRRSLTNIAKVQEEVLLSVLKRQQQTEYGKTWGFHSIKSREEFRHRHPLTDYNHYAEMMERSARGEQNILTKDKVTFIALTSGTTGKNKKYIMTDYGDGSLMLNFVTSLWYYSFPTMTNLKKTLNFQLPAAARKSEGGITMGSASGRYGEVLSDSVCPRLAYKLTQEEESYYVQAVFSLSDPELGSIQGFSSNLFYTFFKFIEIHIESLADDIERGKMSDDCPIKDKAIRDGLSAMLRPDRRRANEIREHLALGRDHLIQRLWPKLDVLTMAKTGGFAHCARILEGSFLKGLRVISVLHGSTEAFCGVNCETEQDCYTFVTTGTFYEFIHVDDVEEEQPRTYFLEQVKLGESYELVVTTFRGLYRFRIGDILKIVGFNHDCPKYEFCYRIGQRLNLAFERTPESFVNGAVEYCCKDLPEGVSVVEYTSTESHVLEGITGETSEDNCYVFFMEVLRDGKEYELDKDHVTMMDTFLRDNHSPYDVFRNKGSISPLKVIQVKSGAFEELKHALWAGYQSAQFKMPHVLRREALLQILLDMQATF